MKLKLAVADLPYKMYDSVLMYFGLTEVFLILGWFGIRKEFCEFLLDTFPLLREYGNISYKFSDTILSDRNESSSDSSLETISYDQQRRKENQRIQVEAVMYIDMPD